TRRFVIQESSCARARASAPRRPAEARVRLQFQRCLWQVGVEVSAQASLVVASLLKVRYSIRLPTTLSNAQMSSQYQTISSLPHHIGETVRVRGWVAHLRSSGKVAFIVLRDGSGTLQCVVVQKVVGDAGWATFQSLTLETSVEIDGEVRADERAPGGVEVGVTNMIVLGTSPTDYPIQPKEHGIDFLLDHRHLWLRSPRQVAIARVRAEL